jgi:hypothetical protein
MSRREREAMYEALARWQWRRRPGAAPSDAGLELRKRLLPPAAPAADGPADGAAGLDAWLRAMVGSVPRRCAPRPPARCTAPA